MSPDPISQKLLEAIVPSNWSQTHNGAHKGIYGLLYGSARGLLTCRGILSQVSTQEYKAWDPDAVFADLSESIRLNREPKWQIQKERRTDVRVWLIGYFINKAYQNIAAALDYVINQWLLDEMRLKKTSIDGVLHLYVLTRLDLLEGILKIPHRLDHSNTEAIKLLQELSSRFRGKVKNLEWFTDRVPTLRKDMNLIEHVSKTLKGQCVDADCVPTVFDRVNTWKHRPGFGRRPAAKKGATDLGWAVEWEIGRRALICVGGIWRLMPSKSVRQQ